MVIAEIDNNEKCIKKMDSFVANLKESYNIGKKKSLAKVTTKPGDMKPFACTVWDFIYLSLEN